MQWIKALDLEMWAETVQAKGKMPGLVSDLIWATASKVRYLRFPNGDKGQVRGYDGELDADSSSSFIPDGRSVWEFGTSGAGKAKAESDYKKRTNEVEPADRANLTLVIVTPRTWDTGGVKLPDWLAEKNALGEWKKVEYLEGTRLENWLSQCPAVASKWASCDLKLTPQIGVQSTEEFWQFYSSRFSPELNESVLLASREDQAKELLEKLTQNSGRLAFAADSPDEVIAFVIAAIRSAPEPIRNVLEARTLVVETEEAVRYCLTLDNLIYLPRQGARASAGRLAREGVTVISAGADEKSHDHVLLRRPSSREMGKAFINMGMNEDAGYQLARTCGRSLAVLARLHPSGTAENPEWIEDADLLIPALLAGSWMADVEPDRSILSLLTRKDYDDAEEELLKFTKMQDAPLERIEDLWAMKASVDAFVYLGHLISRKHLDRFKEAVTSVFSKAAQAHKPPTADQPFLMPGSRDQNPLHTDSLKNGLMNTLLHMAVLHEQAQFKVSRSNPQTFVDEVVRGLPGLSSDYRLIASLEQQLPLLAEASPHPFLEALERQLEGDATIRPIFDEYPGLITPTTYHCGLLWSLEALAWLPDFLQRAALCLAKLAALDPGGKLTNRPINSLRSIFLSWSPGTAVSTQHRLAILESIINDVPVIAWPLLEQLLPRFSDTSTPTTKPRFREPEQRENENLTYGLVWKSEERIVELAIARAEYDPARWSSLIDSLGAVQEPTFELIVKGLGHVLGATQDEQQSDIWNALRKQTLRHRKYQDADWALPSDSIETLEALVERHKPADLVESVSWLFDDWMPSFDLDDETSDPIQAVEDARVAALRGIMDATGFDGVVGLMERVKVPRLVMFSIRGLQLPDNQLLQLFTRLLSSTVGESALAASIVLAHGMERFGGSWATDAKDALQNSGWDHQKSTLVLLGLDETRESWNYVTSFGSETEAAYWSQKSPIRIQGSLEDLTFAIEKYRSVGRSAAALAAAEKRLGELSVAMIQAIMFSAVSEHNADPEAKSIFGYLDVERVFAALAQRSDLPRESLAKLEFMYLPMLRTDNLAIHELLLEQPGFFMDMVSRVFRAEDEEPHDLSEADRKLASATYRLLKGLKKLPSQKGNDVDEAVLTAWCVSVRELAQESNRGKVTDQLIGQILAHAPLGTTDLAWPHEAVRNVIEVLASHEVERGISLERYNMRGVYSKRPDEGGDQERVLASQTREWAAKTIKSVRTSAMLRRIAEGWEADADRADIAAAQRATRW
ncbi:hypothetical protein ACW9I9_06875 [Pseudomonas pergaminensis]